MAPLRADSGTGPDLVATRVLKEYAKALAGVVAELAARIIQCKRWPELWTRHWIVPIFKRGAVFRPENYRAVHLTARLAEAVGRVLSNFFAPQLSVTAFGPAQFAYRKGHGARDALLCYVTSWISAFNRGNKVGVYCSDVSGAFDRVDSNILMRKLASFGVHDGLLGVIHSWLRSRSAFVAVGGSLSNRMTLSNMVYQGTVWGPTLWNAFFGDSFMAIRSAGFSAIIYADDLNACREFPIGTANSIILDATRGCQKELHQWGQANRVTFDASKEGFATFSHVEPSGGCLKILGVLFDPRLRMDEDIHSCCSAICWKMRTLLRTSRFYTVPEMVFLFKTHILSFIEYRTPAWYHASETALRPVNRILTSFLAGLGVPAVEALLKYDLAPLSTRRDIAMLGVIHRSVLGLGPELLRQFFKPQT